MKKERIVKEFIPKNIWGKELNRELSKIGKKKRKKQYIIDSLIFGAIMSVFDIIAILLTNSKSVFSFTDTYFLNFILTVMVTFSILFMISYILDYFVSENAIKKYNEIKEK